MATRTLGGESRNREGLIKQRTFAAVKVKIQKKKKKIFVRLGLRGITDEGELIHQFQGPG